MPKTRRVSDGDDSPRELRQSVSKHSSNAKGRGVAFILTVERVVVILKRLTGS